ncbi:MAG: L-threonylcarbamoyladenylate synthase [Pirellulales bacterium]
MDGSVEAAIQEAVLALRAGRLVALPTETVYGLGADAEQPGAVRRVFEVKGRPRSHPLIVHLAEAAMLGDWSDRAPGYAWELAERFWPGPLTLVVRKSSRVIPDVTGGQDSVGLRVPAHPVAARLLQEFGGGVAAPSANRFGRVSPTTAEHVRRDLGSDVDLVLDGGPCRVGVESTVVDCTGVVPRILRPGGVTREALIETLGMDVPVVQRSDVRAPGQLPTHYAPRAQVMLVAVDELSERVDLLRQTGQRVVVLTEAELAPERLFAALREADESGADWIVAVPPAPSGVGLAVLDRLQKAAAPRPASG